MSQSYDNYLTQHKMNVMSGYYWIKDNLPDIINACPNPIDLDRQMFDHDVSKTRPSEYHPYDAYFYGGEKTAEVVNNFNNAWLAHIHRNPHHWQYWILVHDDPLADTLIEIPYNYILEMICDWWSFSWSKEDLYEIFNWYDQRKDYIRLNPNTRKTVEDILGQIRSKLEELDNA